MMLTANMFLGAKILSCVISLVTLIVSLYLSDRYFYNLPILDFIMYACGTVSVVSGVIFCGLIIATNWELVLIFKMIGIILAFGMCYVGLIVYFHHIVEILVGAALLSLLIGTVVYVRKNVDEQPKNNVVYADEVVASEGAIAVGTE